MKKKVYVYESSKSNEFVIQMDGEYIHGSGVKLRDAIIFAEKTRGAEVIVKNGVRPKTLRGEQRFAIEAEYDPCGWRKMCPMDPDDEEIEETIIACDGSEIYIGDKEHCGDEDCGYVPWEDDDDYMNAVSPISYSYGKNAKPYWRFSGAIAKDKVFDEETYFKLVMRYSLPNEEGKESEKERLIKNKIKMMTKRGDGEIVIIAHGLRTPSDMFLLTASKEKDEDGTSYLSGEACELDECYNAVSSSEFWVWFVDPETKHMERKNGRPYASYGDDDEDTNPIGFRIAEVVQAAFQHGTGVINCK